MISQLKRTVQQQGSFGGMRRVLMDRSVPNALVIYTRHEYSRIVLRPCVCSVLFCSLIRTGERRVCVRCVTPRDERDERQRVVSRSIIFHASTPPPRHPAHAPPSHATSLVALRHAVRLFILCRVSGRVSVPLHRYKTKTRTYGARLYPVTRKRRVNGAAVYQRPCELSAVP